MKKILLLLALAFGMAVSANALTYEEAFDSIKAMPDMKGVDGTEVSGHNDFAAIGVTNGQMLVWSGERGSETGVYGNAIYKLIGELPASEMIQCKMTDSAIFAIFAKPVSKDSNRIIIFSDSAYAGFTGALIGYISNDALNALRTAILIPRQEGGTALYLNAMNF
ncbi:hypothetical protein [uncultured Duncaniella sp.]|uniref:hypothetical protein n=1 Tax=uncultured Duncaniella sp. TaxID=2768039 RepID=UPI0026393798|nr:hypothetical protein [uncultured Duncaniella sp.]